MFEIRVDPDDDYRDLIVEVTVRKNNGDRETLSFSSVNVRQGMGMIRFVD